MRTFSPELGAGFSLERRSSAAVRGTLKGPKNSNVRPELKEAHSDVLARARILERSDVDGALALIRDETVQTPANRVQHACTTVGAADLKWFDDEKLP